ncbi:MAG: acetate kinase [Oscillospiraceae bacterium]|jgi:acetate kinase|nr:acetate kinase [Oscillospiraceae bacterium]
MNVLVINAGSSSLKYQLIDTVSETIIAKGLCDRIGIDGHLKHQPLQNGKPTFDADVAFPTHAEAIAALIEKITSEEYGAVTSLSEIGAVGHRVLHAGEKFSESVLVDDTVIDAIKECIPLGPLHNPANLMGIEACREAMPNVPQVAVFDTAFHQTMPDYAFTYALPYEYYEKYAVRRYGFHGTSHRYVSAKAIEFLGIPKEGSRIIACHLGNGSSIAAIKSGKSIDTSMGLTPLEGVPMGTRSGSIDPAIIEFVANNEGLTREQIFEVLNNKSGVLGISGVSSDFRNLEKAAGDDANPLQKRAALALKIFSYSVGKYIGSYIAALGGVDVITFAGGVGENGPDTRAEIIGMLGGFGISLDPEKNNTRGKLVDITGEGSRTKVLIVPTDEELVIARDTREIVEA